MSGNAWIIVGILAAAVAAFSIPYGFHKKAAENAPVANTPQINIRGGDYVAGDKTVNIGPAGADPQDTARRLTKPRFSEKLEEFAFSMGEGGITGVYSAEALKKEPAYPFEFNGFKPVKLYIEGGILYADVAVYGGTGLPPIKIERQEISGKPVNWDLNSNEKAFEIVSESRIPFFQFYYRTPSHIVVNGVFPFPGGLIIAGPEGATFNPKLPVGFKLKPIFKYPSWKFPGEYADGK